MSDPESSILSPEPISHLAEAARVEFGHALHFIWRTLDIERQERDREARKAEDYFPLGVIPEERLRALLLRRARAAVTGPQTDAIPRLVASSAIFLSVSLFESYLVRLTQSIVLRHEARYEPAKGFGSGQLYKQLERAGLDVSSVLLDTQSRAIRRIRNCLAHYDGLLRLYQDEGGIRKTISKFEFLTPEHIASHERTGGLDHLVWIESSTIGEKLAVAPHYAYLSCSYLRDHFTALCKEASKRFPE